MINYSADVINVRGERNAALRRAALNACALWLLPTRRFAKRRAVDFKRADAMRCR
jgi:hypothetical protein